MPTPFIITTRPPTVEETAELYGVSKRRLKRIIRLADELINARKLKRRSGGTRKRKSATGSPKKNGSIKAVKPD